MQGVLPANMAKALANSAPATGGRLGSSMSPSNGRLGASPGISPDSATSTVAGAGVGGVSGLIIGELVNRIRRDKDDEKKRERRMRYGAIGAVAGGVLGSNVKLAGEDEDDEDAEFDRKLRQGRKYIAGVGAASVGSAVVNRTAVEYIKGQLPGLMNKPLSTSDLDRLRTIAYNRGAKQPLRLATTPYIMGDHYDPTKNLVALSHFAEGLRPSAPIAAHEFGHSTTPWRPHMGIYGLSKVTNAISTLHNTFTPHETHGRIGAAVGALGYLPVLYEELRASGRGSSMLRELSPDGSSGGRLSPFVGVPTYMAVAAVPYIIHKLKQKLGLYNIKSKPKSTPKSKSEDPKSKKDKKDKAEKVAGDIQRSGVDAAKAMLTSKLAPPIVRPSFKGIVYRRAF